MKHINIPNSGGTFINTKTGKFFQKIRAPFDFILQFNGQSIFIDAKVNSVKKKPYLPLSYFRKDKSTLHQYKLFMNKMEGIRGFLVYFVKPNVLSFFHIDHLKDEKNYGSPLGNLEDFDLRDLFVEGRFEV